MKYLILFYSNRNSRYRIFYIVFNVIPAPPTPNSDCSVCSMKDKTLKNPNKNDFKSIKCKQKTELKL